VIAKITGTVLEIHEGSVILEVGGFGYEVLVPGGLALRLRQHGAEGSELALNTIEYIEGGATGAAMIPRLLGFADPMDREFFRLLTSVKGFGPRKALRSLTVPTRRFALAIENADYSALSGLPEIGRRSAEKIVAELKGKCQKFALMREGEPLEAGPAEGLQPDVRSETMQILTAQLQYSAIEAEAMINKALAGGRKFEASQDLISEIFRLMAAGGRA
jgi:Holliday junction DNA helicase RuvA